MSAKLNVKFIFKFKSDERSSVVNVSSIDCFDVVQEETSLIFGESNFEYYYNDGQSTKKLENSKDLFEAIESISSTSTTKQIELELRVPNSSQPESFITRNFQNSSHLSDKTKTELEKLRQEIFEKTRREMNELIQNAKNDFRDSMKDNMTKEFGPTS